MARRFSAKEIAGMMLGGLFAIALSGVARGHHSFAMYEIDKIYVMTGVVTRVDPNPNHLQLFIVPLNEAREKVVRGSDGEPVAWAIEMAGASVAARDGISVNGFPRGTIVSVGFHPLRNGFPGGGRSELGLYKCPPNTPPAPAMHCDSVEGSTSHGRGELPADHDPMPEQAASE